MFDVFIEGRGRAVALSTANVQFGTPAQWRPVGRLLSASDVNQQWLPVPILQNLPSWVLKAASGNAKLNAAGPDAQWVATTAGRIQAIDPYETVVAMTVPAATPVWILATTSHLGGQTSPMFYAAGTIYPGGARFRSVYSGAAFDGIALSRFGTVHPLTLALPEH
jgi:hypothetical protein